MEHSYSWKANGSLANQETPWILWNSEVHYHVHKSPLIVPIQSQMNPVNALPSFFLKMPFYYPPIYAWVFQVVPFLQVSPPNPVCIFFFSSILTKCSTHLILLDLITKLIFTEDYKSCSSSWNFCSLLLFPSS